MTFDEVYEEWSKKKFPTVSESNIKGYKASYKTCGILYNRVFKDLKLADLQQVIDTCGKNFPTLKKIKILFNQLYEFALRMTSATKIILLLLKSPSTKTAIQTSIHVQNSQKKKLQKSGQ